MLDAKCLGQGSRTAPMPLFTILVLLLDSGRRPRQRSQSSPQHLLLRVANTLEIMFEIARACVSRWASCSHVDC